MKSTTYELWAPKSYDECPPEVLEEVVGGCGPGKGLGDWLIPDTIYGLSVKEACRIHDFMYYEGETIEDKKKADRVFLNNLVRIIINYGGWLTTPRLLRANTMYWFVKRFGGPSFWHGKEDK